MFTLRSDIKWGVHPATESECFLMFADPVIDELVIYTNLSGKRIVSLYNSSHCEQQKIWILCETPEMKAFIGLHLIAGAYRGNYRKIKDLWSDMHGPPIFKATMSEEGFYQLKRVFRADDPLRRDRQDKLAPVRHLWSMMQEKLCEFYTAGPYLTIDEQLLEFHGRVGFRQYIASKPGKFGMKILWTCDAQSTYALKGIVYIGCETLTGSTFTEGSFTKRMSLELTKPFMNSGRNVTMDNWFTSVELAAELLSRKTTLIGTIRSNRRDIPKAAKVVTNRVRKSTAFYKSGENLLCSFWDKGTGPVLLLSTMHAQPVLCNSGKAEVVEDYNRTEWSGQHGPYVTLFHIKTTLLQMALCFHIEHGGCYGNECFHHFQR